MTDDGDILQHFSATRRRVVKWNHFLPIYDRLLSPYRGVRSPSSRLVLATVARWKGGGAILDRPHELSESISIRRRSSSSRTESDHHRRSVRPGVLGAAPARCWSDRCLIDDGGHANVQQIVIGRVRLPHVRTVVNRCRRHPYGLPSEALPGVPAVRFMQFAQHVVDVLHGRNPFVTEPVADHARLGRASIACSSSNRWWSSMSIEACADPPKGSRQGREELRLPGRRHAASARSTRSSHCRPGLNRCSSPGRRAAGAALRASRRIAGAEPREALFR